MVNTKKIIIFFGVSDDFKRMQFKQFRDEIWKKGIGSAIYNINDMDSRTGQDEILGTYNPEEVVVCCFHGERSGMAVEILKNLSLNVVAVNSADVASKGAEILRSFKS